MSHTKVTKRRPEYHDFAPANKRWDSCKKTLKITVIATRIIVALAGLGVAGVGGAGIMGMKASFALGFMQTLGNTITYAGSFWMTSGGLLTFVMSTLALTVFYLHHRETSSKVYGEKLTIPLANGFKDGQEVERNTEYSIYELSLKDAEAIFEAGPNQDRFIIVKDPETKEHVVYYYERGSKQVMHITYEDPDLLCEAIKPEVFDGRRPLSLVFNRAEDKIRTPWISQNFRPFVFIPKDDIDFKFLDRNLPEGTLFFCQDGDRYVAYYRQNGKVIPGAVNEDLRVVMNYLNNFLKPHKILNILPWLDDKDIKYLHTAVKNTGQAAALLQSELDVVFFLYEGDDEDYNGKYCAVVHGGTGSDSDPYITEFADTKEALKAQLNTNYSRLNVIAPPLGAFDPDQGIALFEGIRGESDMQFLGRLLDDQVIIARHGDIYPDDIENANKVVLFYRTGDSVTPETFPSLDAAVANLNSKDVEAQIELITRRDQLIRGTELEVKFSNHSDWHLQLVLRRLPQDHYIVLKTIEEGQASFTLYTHINFAENSEDAEDYQVTRITFKTLAEVKAMIYNLRLNTSATMIENIDSLMPYPRIHLNRMTPEFEDYKYYADRLKIRECIFLSQEIEGDQVVTALFVDNKKQGNGKYDVSKSSFLKSKWPDDRNFPCGAINLWLPLGLTLVTDIAELDARDSQKQDDSSDSSNSSVEAGED